MRHEYAQPTPEALAAEQALIAQAQAGNDTAGTAFGELFEIHRPDLVRFAAYFVGPSDAEDVVQTVAIKALQSIGDFDDRKNHGTALPWFSGATRNAAIDHIRYMRVRGRGGLLNDPDELPNLIEANTERRDTDPATAAIEQDGVRRIEHALAKLSPVHASVIRAIYLEGLTLAEYRDREQIADGTAKTRHMKAKQHLAELISAGEVNLAL